MTALLWLGMVLGLGPMPAAAQTHREGAREFVAAWEYRWGDSPRDAQGKLIWAQRAGDYTAEPAPQGEPTWLSLGRTETPQPPGRNGQRFLWLRTELPSLELHDPTLYIIVLNQLMEAYLDGQLIYNFGKLDGNGPDSRRFLGYRTHFIPLPEHHQGGTLTLRIYSEHINIGIGSPLQIGSKSQLILNSMRDDSGKSLVGSVLCAIGLFVIGLFLTLRRESAYLYYGGFAFTIGLWLICQMRTRLVLIDSPLLWSYVDLFSLYTAAACICQFMAQAFGRGPLGLMPIAAMLLTVYALGAALLVATGILGLMPTVLPFELLFLAVIVYLLINVASLLRKGNRDAWLFAIGFIAAAGPGIFDLLATMGVFRRLDPRLSQFGQGTFVILLGCILVRRFQSVHSDLVSTRQALSEQVRTLEVRNTEIETLNQELRHQIEARSKQLVDSLIGGSSSGDSQESISVFADGSLLDQRYRVVRTIGQGAMGVVYEVERVHDSRHFAAKVLSRRAHRRELARFAREAQVLARLKHQNLVSISDVELTDSRLAYIVMELVEGSTLEAQHHRFGELLFALPILRQLADALAKVHAEGIIHRDLKPANILVMRADAGGEAVIKVVDFGLSALMAGGGELSTSQDIQLEMTLGAQTEKTQAQTEKTQEAAELALERTDLSALTKDSSTTEGLLNKSGTDGARSARDILTQTGVIMGTPLYMAPELVHGARLAQPAADIFSFGIIAYELLTGDRPTDVPPSMMALKPFLRWYAPLSMRCHDLPEDIGGLIERCLDASPEHRPSAAELAAALRRPFPRKDSTDSDGK